MPRARAGTAIGEVRPARAPRFSVVIPTHNRATLLTRAVGSVLAQSVEDLEVIVVDDGSTDHTLGVVGGIEDPRIRYVWQPNAGLSAARNRGAATARGRFLTFLDDDDEALPGWLETFATMLADPRCGVACCGIAYVSHRDGSEEVVLPSPRGPLYRDQTCLFRAGTYALRRELFEATGGFRVAGRSQQTELAIRLIPMVLERGLVISSVPRPFVRAHAHPLVPGHHREKMAGALAILERHADLFRSAPAVRQRYLATAGVSAARIGRYREARRYLTRALAARPVELRSYGRLLVALLPPVARRVWPNLEGRG
jgi:glycosyltransferase involved in cell wall biosynthesis